MDESSIPCTLTFPSDVLKFMKQNATPKMALMLMEICKYFQHQEFPYFVVKTIFGESQAWKYYTLDGQTHRTNNLNNISTKQLWITEKLTINFIEEPELSALLSKIAVCDIKDLGLSHMNISVDEFKFMTAGGDVERITMSAVEILNGDGGYVTYQDIFNHAPKLQYLSIYSTHTNMPPKFPILDPDIPILPNLKLLDLRRLAKDFDISLFSSLMLKNSHVKYYFDFNAFFDAEDVDVLEDQLENLKLIWPLGNVLPEFSYHIQS